MKIKACQAMIQTNQGSFRQFLGKQIMRNKILYRIIKIPGKSNKKGRKK